MRQLSGKFQTYAYRHIDHVKSVLFGLGCHSYQNFGNSILKQSSRLPKRVGYSHDLMMRMLDLHVCTLLKTCGVCYHNYQNLILSR